MRKVGYARVSTVDQDTALQMDALKKAGVRTVFRESGSGVGPRPELHRAVSTLCAGDVLVVWKIDRIARSLVGLLHILQQVQSVGAGLQSLTEPIDTSTPIGEFTVHILGAVAQLERSIIRERVVAGQVAARARGKTWGRRRGVSPEEESAIAEMYAAGGYTIPELALCWSIQEWVVRTALYRQFGRGNLCAAKRG